MEKKIDKIEVILRDIVIMMFESLWKFLEKRESRFKYYNLGLR